MAKRKKAEKVDGLGVRELQQIHSAVRLVWQRSRARALVVKRCTGKGGFLYCELKKCGKRTPSLKVDHIEAVGQVGGPGYIQRMFVPSTQLQGLCKKCHDAKTRAEKAAAKKATVKAEALVAAAIKRNTPTTGVKKGRAKKAPDFTDLF